MSGSTHCVVSMSTEFERYCTQYNLQEFKPSWACAPDTIAQHLAYTTSEIMQNLDEKLQTEAHIQFCADRAIVWDRHRRHYTFVQQYLHCLDEHGIAPHVCSPSTMSAEQLKAYNIVHVLGGDGTFVRVARQIGTQLLVGVASTPESVGGNCVMDSSNFRQGISRLSAGDYTVLSGTKAQVDIYGAEAHHADALNEIGLTTLFDIKMRSLRFGVFDEDVDPEIISSDPLTYPRQDSSGIIVATGSGSGPGSHYSTAWGVYRKFAPSSLFTAPIAFPKDALFLRFVVREPQTGGIYECKTIDGMIEPGKKLLVESLIRGVYDPDSPVQGRGCVHIDGGFDEALVGNRNGMYWFEYGNLADIRLSEHHTNLVSLPGIDRVITGTAQPSPRTGSAR